MPYKLAKRMESIAPSATKAMTAKARELKARGKDVVALTQGEPDFGTPPAICDAGVAAIREGHTRYTAVPGILELREAIVAKLERDHGLKYTPEEIIVGCGAKQVLFNALYATLDAGDEVVVPAPCWVSYPELVKLAGGTPVLVDCTSETGFKITSDQLAQAITPKTRWLMLNSPSNPTGAVYSTEELGAIAEVLRKHPDVCILTDDIYEKLVYAPATFATIAEVAPDLQERTLLVNGVSKSHAMTGWRVGYGAGPAGLIKAMNTVQGQTTSHTSSISQYASVAALSGDQSFLDEFRATFQTRRDYVCARLNAIPGLSCQVPDGAFYVFVSCKELIGRSKRDGSPVQNDMDVAMVFLEDFGVGVVPGSSFLAKDYFRISYAASTDELEKACDRIEAACKFLMKVE